VDLGLIIGSLPALARGAAMTLFVSLTAIALGLVLGMLLSFARMSANRWLSAAARFYISALRGIPILVLLLMVFYLLPAVGLEAPPLVAAIAALTLNTAAFQAEIYRGGFAVIPPGQIEAARVLGLSETRIKTRILIPQVIWLVTPALVNEIIVLLKNSSLVSVIAVTELMRVSQQLVSKTYKPTEIYLAACLLYVLMNLCLSALGSRLRRRIGGASAGGRP
jgi:polar amino acid transport system permease protein